MESVALVDLVERYRQNGDLLSLLKSVQRRCGGLDRDTTAQLAEQIGLPVSELYGVITFYAFLSPRPLGRNVIRVCRCLPCTNRDSQTVLGTIKEELGIGPGETTVDRRFTLQMVNCIGACDVTPSMMVNEKRYGNLTPARVAQVLGSYL
ncbi:MAG: NADH-quinone oxidoreductase subunit NuoE family protein [Chloroflexota bacterium]